MRSLALFPALAFVVALVPVGAAAQTADVANPFTTSTSRAAVIHFVPLDPGAERLLAATVPGVKKWLHNSSEITAIPKPGSNWVNRERRQIDSNAVMADLLARFGKAQGPRLAFVVPVTSYSLYSPDSPEYRFIFGARGLVPAAVNGTQAVAIIGTAEMRVYHPAREHARLTKMMLRYIGEVLCRLPRSGNPTSVMYQPILSDTDLDRMVAKLPARC